MDLDEFEVEIKREFITEAIEMLEETESAFLDLENDPSDGKIMDKIFRLAHTIKGSAYAAGFIELAEFAHVFETLLGMLRNSEIDVSEEVVDVLLYSNDALIKFIKILEKDSESVLDTFAAKEAISKLITDGGAELAVAPNVDSDSGSGFHLFDDDDKASTSEPVEKAEAMEGQRAGEVDRITVVPEKNILSSPGTSYNLNPAAPLARNILIVDDEPEIIDIIAGYIEDMGHHIFRAEHGMAGLEVLRSQDIDLILSDVRMPEMDGLVFVGEVRKTNQNIPIIFVTGASEKADVVRCLNLGAFSMIEKPFDEATIQLNVTNALRMKVILDAVVKLSSLNFRAYISSMKLSAMTSTTPAKDRTATQTRLESILDEIAVLTNLTLNNQLPKAS